MRLQVPRRVILTPTKQLVYNQTQPYSKTIHNLSLNNQPRTVWNFFSRITQGTFRPSTDLLNSDLLTAGLAVSFHFFFPFACFWQLDYTAYFGSLI